MSTWFESIAEAQRRARRRLPSSVYSALHAGSEKGLTLRDNVDAFDELRFAPRTAGLPARRSLSTTVLGQKVRLFDSRRHPVRRFGDVAGKPGTIVAIGDQTVSIAVQGGTIEIGKVRTESGQKSSAGVFAKSHGLSVGDSFESEPKESLAAAAG